MEVENNVHIGRSWSGHSLEDVCPCVQEPCGLVRVSDINPACPEHSPGRSKTIRQRHYAGQCPKIEAAAQEEAGRVAYERARVDPGAPHWRELSEDDRKTWVELGDKLNHETV